MYILKIFVNLQRENDIQGAESPLILYTYSRQMNVSEIIDAISNEIVARGCYLVDVTVSKDNDVEITMESEDTKVEIDDCVAVSRAFEAKFDREKEDYSITVSSAGLDQPFKVMKQFIKAIGKKVEVSLKGGRKMVAVLDAADEDSITLRYTVKEAVEGKKKKEFVEHVDRFTMDQVNAVRPFIEFE